MDRQELVDNILTEVILAGKRKRAVSKKDAVGVRLNGVIKHSDFTLGPKFIPAMIADDIRIIMDSEFTHK